MRLIWIVLLAVGLSGCAQQYPNTSPMGLTFPDISGTSLADQKHQIPKDFAGAPVLLLLGYKQDSQFDIDRWLIGLDMTETQVPVYELPTIAGMGPRVFQSQIDNGMRRGIPSEMWQGVITVYEDGDSVQAFTGNQLPNNARVLLLDPSSKIVFFYDRGFSVSALNQLREALSVLQQSSG